MGGNAAQDNRSFGTSMPIELPATADGEALVRGLVDDVQHAVLSPLVGAILDEVVGPGMVQPLGWQTDTRSVRHKQPTAFGLPGRDIQPLAPPDPLDPLVIDDPTRRATQQLDDLAIAKAAVLAGEFDEVGRELRLVVAAPRDLSLGRAMLRKHAADPPLGQLQLTTNMLGAGQAARGAQKFPRAASFRMSLSSVRSDSARQSRVFCACNSFSCFTWSSLSPPNSWRQRKWVTSVTLFDRTASATGWPCDTITSTCP